MSTLFVNNLNTASGSTITIPSGKTLKATDTPIVGVGNVIQVVHSSINAQESTTSNTFVDTALHVNITPTFSNSKILVRASVGLYNNTNAGAAAATIIRGSTNLFHSTWGFGYIYASAGGGIVNGIPIETLDSPSTTSQITYRVQISRTSVQVGTAHICVNNSFSTMTAMEIAQ